MRLATTFYLLDHRNCIRAVGGVWNQFALDNDGFNILARDVCGRPLWDFVTGDVTRMWLTTIFDIARVREASIERPYRCDSPDLERFMRMRIVPGNRGSLHVTHQMLSTEQRAAPVHFTCAVNEHRRGISVRCSMCGRLKLRSVWEEPDAEEAGPSRMITVVYSICEDCHVMLPGIAS